MPLQVLLTLWFNGKACNGAKATTNQAGFASCSQAPGITMLLAVQCAIPSGSHRFLGTAPWIPHQWLGHPAYEINQSLATFRHDDHIQTHSETPPPSIICVVWTRKRSSDGCSDTYTPPYKVIHSYLIRIGQFSAPVTPWTKTMSRDVCYACLMKRFIKEMT